MSEARRTPEQSDTRDIMALLTWLEYGRNSGFRAARCSEAQEEYWADRLRETLQQRDKLLAACKEVLSWMDHANAVVEPEDRAVRERLKAAVAKAGGTP